MKKLIEGTEESTKIEYDVLLFEEYFGDQYNEDIKVLFLRDNKLFEYHDWHCSCHEFEGNEEEINIDENTREYIMRIFKLSDKEVDLIMEKIYEAIPSCK